MRALGLRHPQWPIRWAGPICLTYGGLLYASLPTHPCVRRALSSSWCWLVSERRVWGLSPSTPPASSVVAPMDSVGRARIYHIFPARHIADLLDIYPERVQKPEA